MVEDPMEWNARLILGNDGASDYQGTYTVLDGLSEECLYNGAFFSKANENTTVIDIPLSKNITQYLILIAETDKGRFVNHYINYGGALRQEEYLAFLNRYVKYTEIKKF